MSSGLNQLNDRPECRIDTMIAGAEKGGTTSLASHLARHPYVLSHFKNEAKVENVELSIFFEVKYHNIEQFKYAYLKAFGRFPKPNEIVIGKSVDLMHRPDGATSLHRYYPACKLIFILRNPVDRAYSSYWYQRFRGEETAETFEEALELERERESAGIWAPHRRYLGKGHYAQYLESFASVFGRNQIHVLLLEDLHNDRMASLGALCDFLGLERISDDYIQVKNPSKANRWPWLAQLVQQDSRSKATVRWLLPRCLRRSLFWWLRRVNAVERRPKPMNPETRELLIRYFEPHNARLQRFLARDLGHWNR